MKSGTLGTNFHAYILSINKSLIPLSVLVLEYTMSRIYFMWNFILDDDNSYCSFEMINVASFLSNKNSLAH